MDEFFRGLRVDIVVNNAGISMRDSFADVELEMCQTITNTNLLSQISVCKAIVPKMIQEKTGQIVNVVSGAGVLGVPMRTVYSASKFGLSGFGKALRAELYN